MPGGGVNGTCRVYMAEEVGIIRNVMNDLAEGSADSPIAVGRSSTRTGLSHWIRDCFAVRVGVDRGLGE